MEEYSLKVQETTLGRAWRRLNLLAFKGSPQHMSSNAHYFNCKMIITNIQKLDLNLGDIGYSKMKFKNLIRLYWDEEAAANYITRLWHYRKDDSDGRKYVVSTALEFKSRGNRTGACLQYISVGFVKDEGWIVNVRTRANEIAQRMFADLIFVHLLLKKTMDVLGEDFDSSKITVYWTIDAVYQSVIGANLWMALSFTSDQIKGFFNKPDTELTAWQRKVKSRYEKNFSLEDERKVYNYSVQRRATECYDLILEGKTVPVDNNTLYDLLEGMKVDPEKIDEIFGGKGGGK